MTDPAKKLSHTDASGKASMIDVGDKPVTKRSARACAFLLLNREAFEAVRDNQVKKGDVLGVARVAAVMAAKQTSSLIPLCHGINITSVDVQAELVLKESLPGVVVACRPDAHGAVAFTTTAHAADRTGVEMEALVAASMASMAAWDMVKAVDPRMVVVGPRLEAKTGGRSGDFLAEPWPAA